VEQVLPYLLVIEPAPFGCIRSCVEQFRPITVFVSGLWGVAAVLAIARPIPALLWVQLLLVSTTAYLIGVGVFISAQRVPTAEAVGVDRDTSLALRAVSSTLFFLAKPSRNAHRSVGRPTCGG
jgi:hypothetical protein